MMYTCKNCNTELSGKFCHNCGQKRITPHERTLAKLFEEFFHYFSHLDSKFFKTLKNVLVRPGLVSRDIMEGITVRHFKISTLFLLGALLYFLIPQKIIGYGFLNTPLGPQLKSGLYREWKEEKATEKMAHNALTFQEYENLYNHKLETNGKLLTLLLIPLTIPVLFILNLLLRIVKREHVITTFDLAIASLEINSGFVYLLFLLAGLTITLLQRLLINPQNQDSFQSISLLIIVSLTLVWLYSFFKRIYNLRWPLAVASVVFFVFGYTFVVVFYQLLSFIILF